jgi:hypothetical protein
MVDINIYVFAKNIWQILEISSLSVIFFGTFITVAVRFEPSLSQLHNLQIT